jgi:hypothetical protein
VTGDVRTCACGCGRSFEVPAMGRPRKFFDGACRVRDWRASSAPEADAVTKVETLYRPQTAAEWNELRRRVARAEAARDEAGAERVNARIRAEFAAEDAA